MKLIELSSNLFDHDVQFESVIPLAGEFERNELLEDLFDFDGLREELLDELGLGDEIFDIDDYDHFTESIADNHKFGMVAEINIREYKYTSENSAKGLASRRVYIIYAETYEKLLQKALNKAKFQREKERENYRLNGDIDGI